MDPTLFPSERGASPHTFDLDRCLATEWLETDGRGGYASSTVPFCPTRQYHGLLVTRIPGTSRRCVALSRFEETLHFEERSFPLSTAQYPDGVIHPEGFSYLEHFESCPYPRAIYRFGDVRIERALQMKHGTPLVLVRYTVLDGEGPFRLELRPLFALRDADHLSQATAEFHIHCETLSNGIRVKKEGLPAVTLSLEGPHSFEAAADWYRSTTYRADQERGFAGREDLFTPGVLWIELAPGEPVFLAATTEEVLTNPRRAFGEEARRRQRELEDAEAASGSRTTIRAHRAAEDFLYRDAHGRAGVLAGFPWFGEWGRDVFIALPGLTLARGRSGECAEVLLGALPFLRKGLLPNIYGPTSEESQYGSVDAALWFARAVDLFEESGASATLLREKLQPALLEIAEWYWRGTDLCIHADAEGLIVSGSADLNSTWMYARTHAGPVTPRAGFAVEINALWLALLTQVTRFLELEQRFDEAARWRDRGARAGAAFLARFWLPESETLADTWNADAVDSSVRPNMVIAAALKHSPLSTEQRQAIVARAKAELLTPKGLRTLSPTADAYCSAFRGGPDERDNAYHQGTVWPWLMGFYTEASLRAFGPTETNVRELNALWDGLAVEFDRAGLNHLSEVFDGDAPHQPGGTIAQAWNTGEYLRARKLLSPAGLVDWNARTGATR